MIGIFGGSFDPVHHGHLIVGQVAAEQLKLDSLRFLPAREQPFKAGQHHTAAEHRVAMLSRAVAGVRSLTIDRTELNRPGPSYTVDTLRELHEQEPGAEFVLLLGADAAVELPAWKEAERLPDLARIAVFGRPGSPVPDLPWISTVVDVPAIGISATQVRRRARAGLSLRYWVPDAVAEYITSHQLYLDPE